MVKRYGYKERFIWYFIELILISLFGMANKYNTSQHNTAQYNTTQHNSTAAHNTTQLNTEEL